MKSSSPLAVPSRRRTERLTCGSLKMTASDLIVVMAKVCFAITVAALAACAAPPKKQPLEAGQDYDVTGSIGDEIRGQVCKQTYSELAPRIKWRIVPDGASS